jgi:hypothetical protein
VNQYPQKSLIVSLVKERQGRGYFMKNMRLSLDPPGSRLSCPSTSISWRSIDWEGVNLSCTQNHEYYAPVVELSWVLRTCDTVLNSTHDKKCCTQTQRIDSNQVGSCTMYQCFCVLISGRFRKDRVTLCFRRAASLLTRSVPCHPFKSLIIF